MKRLWTILTIISTISFLLTVMAGELSAAEEKVISAALSDGILIRCHYSSAAGNNEIYPREVLEASSKAYLILKDRCGFSREGFSFASADPRYAYDPDKTIDIYIGDPGSSESFGGYPPSDFKTSYFDTRHSKADPNAYDAIILMPNKPAYIKPKSQGALPLESHETTMLGTMVHEMTHLFNFYYNKNMKAVCAAKKTGWFVEGLARYFETKAGSLESFYSKGYIMKRGRAFAYLEEGVNYYLEHPDRSLDRLEYDYAIFWKFLDETYGAEAIEHIAAAMRNLTSLDGYEDAIRAMLESATGDGMEGILKDYTFYLYKKSVSAKTRDPLLSRMSQMISYFDGARFYTFDNGRERPLGKALNLDEGSLLAGEELRGLELVGADTTSEADVKPWAVDLHKIIIDEKTERAPRFTFRNLSRARLMVQVITGEDTLRQSWNIYEVGAYKARRIFDKDENAKVLYILISNVDSRQIGSYEIVSG